jgi:hypothetical protein
VKQLNTRQNPPPRLGQSAKVQTPAGCQRVVDPADALAPHLIEKPFKIAGKPQT